jgi:CheY-like chemotaxis protein
LAIKSWKYIKGAKMARKLLLADDSITIQKVVELVLAEEGFEIKAVNNGEEALAVASTFQPDIVLADIEMPKMNGYQLCEKLKTNPATGDVPVILLSGAFEPLDEELAKQVKADSFVIKPFESQELISKINAALVTAPKEEIPSLAIEAEEVAEFADVAEAIPAEEDLWAMEAVEEAAEEAIGIEEIPEAITEDIGLPTFEPAEVEAEEIGPAEPFEIVEEAGIEVAPVIEEEISLPPVEKIAAPFAPEKVMKMPEITLPSKEEFASMFRKSVDEKVLSFMSTLNIKDELLSTVAPTLKDSIEKVLWEIAPELTEKVLRDVMQSSVASLNKEIEKVIWETVPEIAERLISKEIEKIRSEM